MRHNEYLIFTLTESINPDLHLLKLLKSIHYSGIMELGVFSQYSVHMWLSARVRDKLTCRGTTAATRVPRWRIGERPREVAQEGSTR